MAGKGIRHPWFLHDRIWRSGARRRHDPVPRHHGQAHGGRGARQGGRHPGAGHRLVPHLRAERPRARVHGRGVAEAERVVLRRGREARHEGVALRRVQLAQRHLQGTRAERERRLALRGVRSVPQPGRLLPLDDRARARRLGERVRSRRRRAIHRADARGLREAPRPLVQEQDNPRHLHGRTRPSHARHVPRRQAARLLPQVFGPGG